MSTVKFDYFLWFLSGIGILITFLIASLGWLINDDFLFIVKIKELGIISFLIDFYNTWDGRQLSFPGLIQVFLHKFSAPSFSMIFYLLGFYIFSVLFFHLIFKLNLKFLTSISFCFIFSLFPFLKHIIFWQTGGVYVLFLLQGLFIIYLYIYNYVENKLLFFLLIFFLSINSQNVIIPIGIFLIISTTLKFWKNREITSKQILSFSGLALGQFFIAIAPGNFIRLEDQAGSLSLYESINNIPKLYTMMFAYAKYPLVISFLIFLYFGKFVTYSREKIYNLIILFAVLCFSSILLFAKFPGIAYPRALFLFPLLSFPLGAFIGVIFSRFINLFLSKIIIVSVNLISIYFFLNQFILVRDCSNQIKLRTEYLLNFEGSIEEVIYENIKCDKVLLLTVPSQESEWRPYLSKFYNINNLIFSE